MSIPVDKGGFSVPDAPWDLVGHQFVTAQAGTVTNDTSTGRPTAPIKVDNSAQNQPVTGVFAETTGLTASALNANLVPSTDISNYTWWSLQVTGTWNGTLTFQGSNDNTNWQATQVINVNNVLNFSQQQGGNGLYGGPRLYRYLRVAMTSYNSGTANGTLELYTLPPPLSWLQANVNDFPNNTDNAQLLASAAISSNGNSGDQGLPQTTKGIYLYINTGAFGASESTMTVTIQGRDPVSGQYFTILTSASLSASTFYSLLVYPGTTASANLVANQPMPKTFRITWQASNWGTGGSVLGIGYGAIV